MAAADLTQERGPDPERAPGHGLSSISAGDRNVSMRNADLCRRCANTVLPAFCLCQGSPLSDARGTASRQINYKDYGTAAGDNA